MSDTSNDDPMLAFLHARRNLLKEKMRDTQSRIDEIDGMIVTLEDGRSRVNRKRKAGNMQAIDEARGSLRSDTPFDADGAAP